MTIRLRAHHLLCLQTYVGKGYSAAFVANYDAIAERLSRGESVRLVTGPDAICAPLLSPGAAAGATHCHRQSVARRDATALEDLGSLLGRSLRPGDTLTLEPALLQGLRAAFRDGTTRRACIDCQWSELCSRVANDDYAGTRVNVDVIASR
ncbi:DUF1284 domain-containing protein [Halomonas sp. IOP_31]|uniref:DUF1284 domain-containing protein n=1 Tax=Halomonas sp. IOP_31 TaxID=2876584 RepID=UPI001E361CFB|nr:DUF1284 domain-containing protein [Halomonas sp. IOP_31]